MKRLIQYFPAKAGIWREKIMEMYSVRQPKEQILPNMQSQANSLADLADAAEAAQPMDMTEDEGRIAAMPVNRLMMRLNPTGMNDGQLVAAERMFMQCCKIQEMRIQGELKIKQEDTTQRRNRELLLAERMGDMDIDIKKCEAQDQHKKVEEQLNQNKYDMRIKVEDAKNRSKVIQAKIDADAAGRKRVDDEAKRQHSKEEAKEQADRKRVDDEAKYKRDLQSAKEEADRKRADDDAKYKRDLQSAKEEADRKRTDDRAALDLEMTRRKHAAEIAATMDTDTVAKRLLKKEILRRSLAITAEDAAPAKFNVRVICLHYSLDPREHGKKLAERLALQYQQVYGRMPQEGRSYYGLHKDMLYSNEELVEIEPVARLYLRQDRKRRQMRQNLKWRHRYEARSGARGKAGA